ncbi:MAG: hypothetical protein IID15_08215 [Candidatus Marinimicrobia bacterium]|nr:hypothetical protein [Candidatus Neomarinimicrobiota bacterium]
MTTTDFSDSLDSGVPAWSRWNSNKHLVSAISSVVSDMAAEMDPRQNIASARARLENAVDLHERIRASGIRLRDDTAAYQNNWISALDKLTAENAADFEFLDLLS